MPHVVVRQLSRTKRPNLLSQQYVGNNAHKIIGDQRNITHVVTGTDPLHTTAHKTTKPSYELLSISFNPFRHSHMSTEKNKCQNGPKKRQIRCGNNLSIQASMFHPPSAAFVPQATPKFQIKSKGELFKGHSKFHVLQSAGVVPARTSQSKCCWNYCRLCTTFQPQQKVLAYISESHFRRKNNTFSLTTCIANIINHKCLLAVLWNYLCCDASLLDKLAAMFLLCIGCTAHCHDVCRPSQNATDNAWIFYKILRSLSYFTILRTKREEPMSRFSAWERHLSNGVRKLGPQEWFPLTLQSGGKGNCFPLIWRGERNANSFLQTWTNFFGSCCKFLKNWSLIMPAKIEITIEISLIERNTVNKYDLVVTTHPAVIY